MKNSTFSSLIRKYRLPNVRNGHYLHVERLNYTMIETEVCTGSSENRRGGSSSRRRRRKLPERKMWGKPWYGGSHPLADQVGWISEDRDTSPAVISMLGWQHVGGTTKKKHSALPPDVKWRVRENGASLPRPHVLAWPDDRQGGSIEPWEHRTASAWVWIQYTVLVITSCRSGGRPRSGESVVWPLSTFGYFCREAPAPVHHSG